MTAKLDFNQTVQQRWNFWGMQFDFTFPGPDQDILEMQSSISAQPGDEPWGFYEQARDMDSGQLYSTGQYQIMDMENLTSDQIESILPHRKLHFSRRRFNHSWFVEYAGRESFWFDIWIHRVEADCDLLDPVKLQQAHLAFLTRNLRDPAKPCEDELFDDQGPDWQALNWRQELIQDLPWQVYDEISGVEPQEACFFGHSYLLPLTQHHYMQCRFYRLNASHYREAESDFEQLVQFIMQKSDVKLHPKTMAALNNQPRVLLEQPDLSKQLSPESLRSWRKLDKLLRNKTFQSSATLDTPTTETKPENDHQFAILMGLVAIVIFVCLGKGYFFIQDWLTAHPDSQWHSVTTAYFLIVLIWCLRDRIKKWA